jgi:hypothetical protein
MVMVVLSERRDIKSAGVTKESKVEGRTCF